MPLSHKDLYRIYMDSLSFQERIQLNENFEVKIRKHNFVQNKNLWITNISSTNERFFNSRIEWSDWSNKLELLLGKLDIIDEGNFTQPQWVTHLHEIALQYRNFNVHNNSINDDNDIPFAKLINPVVSFCLSQIKPLSLELLNTNAQRYLRLSLLKELANLVQQVLLAEFYNFRINTKGSYANFVNQIASDDFCNILKTYPVMAKLLALKTLYWTRNINEILDRLVKDWPEIVINTTLPQDIKRARIITDFEFNLSDKHNQGKTVVIISMGPDFKIVYKPRGLSNEAKFYSFLDWIAKKSGFKYRELFILDKENYGWMEYVPHTTTFTTKRTALYYRNVGRLLCILYLLGATDIHNENLIASEAYPVIVDLETLFTPFMHPDPGYLTELDELITYLFGDSVFRSGILPHWSVSPNGQVYDNSALSTFQSRLSIYPKQIWHYVNEDKMYFEYSHFIEKPQKNIALLNNKNTHPIDYLNQIEDGFQEIYEFLLVNKNIVAKELLSRFGKQEIRFVFRATKVYTLLLNYLRHPDFLKSIDQRNIHLDILSKGLVTNLEKKYRFWEILDLEFDALNENDIPYFYTYTKSTNLYNNGRLVLKNCFLKSGFDSSIQRLYRFGSKDMTFQLKMIRESIITAQVESQEKHSERTIVSSKSIQKEKLLLIANGLGNQIIQNAIMEPTGQYCTWVSYVSNIVSHVVGYKPIGPDLCNGNMGVGVFLAALYRATNDKTFESYCFKALAPVLSILENQQAQTEFCNRYGIGGTIGLGSLIYGFTKIGQLLEDGFWIDTAYNFTQLLSETLINNSIRSDVVSGSAGCLLSLIALHQYATDSQKAILYEKIVLCSSHILQSRKSNDLGYASWEFQQDKFLVGFSHGSSGILFALSKLYQIHQKTVYSDVIKSILEFEENEYSSIHNNWPDYRFETKSMDAMGWCHGAPGVGFSRLELVHNKFFDQARRDIELATEKVIEYGLGYLDTLCCGNFGRIDFLLSKSLKDQNERLLKYCYQMTDTVIQRYEKHGKFNCFRNFDTNDINVGFFQGVSGIGYQLLRLYDPLNFPSVLIFD